MIIRHHLAKGHNDIPIKDLRFATEHQSRGGQVTHIGWKVIGEYGGENQRAMKHRYEVIFNVEEARLFKDNLEKLLARFDSDEVERLVQEATDTEVDDEDGGTE